MASNDMRLNLLKIKCRSYDLTYHCTWTQHLTSRDTEIKYLLEIGLQVRQNCIAHPEYSLTMRFITGTKQLKLINRDVCLGIYR